MNKLQDLLKQLKSLEKEIAKEVQKKEEEFFRNRGKKSSFDDKTRRDHKALATRVRTYLSGASFLNILSTPLIWLCLIPAALLDILLSIYQAICFPLYGIPKVIRGEYVVIDRHYLEYLNIIEKLNCVYCGYFNGVIAYVQEIAARTEQYWCPIKHARKVLHSHSRYEKFHEYGDGHAFKDDGGEVRKDFGGGA